MGFPILVRWHLYLVPWSCSLSCKSDVCFYNISTSWNGSTEVTICDIAANFTQSKTSLIWHLWWQSTESLMSIAIKAGSRKWIMLLWLLFILINTWSAVRVLELSWAIWSLANVLRRYINIWIFATDFKCGCGGVNKSYIMYLEKLPIVKKNAVTFDSLIVSMHAEES